MFELQRKQLCVALEGAGLCPEAASSVADVLCNSIQALRHAGPITHDTTPPSMRLVTPDIRKHELPGFDFPEGDPDYRQPRIRESEDAPPPEQSPSVVQSYAPQQVVNSVGVAGGAYTDTRPVLGATQVNVRAQVNRQPPAGLPIAMIDSQSNKLIGKRLRAGVGQGGERLTARITETNQDVSLELQFKNLKEYDVVTGLEYVPGQGLRIQTSKLTAWDERAAKTSFIPTEYTEVLTGIADDLRGFRAHTKRIPTFEARVWRNQHQYFNTFRVGTFTGAWAHGTTTTVSQVWPDGGGNVTVTNLTQSVPNTTDALRYVLFAPRTQDEINTDEVKGEDEGPILTAFPPVVEYIALEIQSGTDDCTVFNYLNGLSASGLAGYEAGTCKALSYDTDTDCLIWRSEEIAVITEVIYSPAAITFMQKNVRVLCADAEPTVALTIPIEECPPPGCAGTCTYEWSAYSSSWILLSNTCEEGCACGASPVTPGSYDGEQASQACEPA